MTRQVATVLAVVLCASAAGAQSVFISELMVGNDGSYCDSLGDDPDWIELHNPTDAAVDLGGWALTDQLKRKPSRWTIPPNTIIDAKGYLVIFLATKKASKADRPDAKDLHTNFRLSVDGDLVALMNAKGVEVHRVRFGKQERDTSIGSSDRYEPFGPLRWPTPGLPNDAPKPPSRCPSGHK